MRLGDLFPPAGGAAGRAQAAPPSGDPDVTALAFDHREVTPGTAFFCVRGLTRDGHEFAADAVAAGAAALVVDHPLGLGVPEVVVGDVRAAMAPAAARLAGDPTSALRMVGITGTNGKTTTSYLASAVLAPDGPGRPGCGMVGTVATRVGGVERAAIRTTPEAIDLQRTFRAMLEAGDTSCVMEVSSHALALHRAAAIHWDVAAFTNLGHDHLDFHPDLEDYFQTKRELFETAAAQGAALIVCSDDEYGRRLATEFAGTITVALEDDSADLRATALEPGIASTSFDAGGTRFTVPLPGRFNVLNALVVIAAARALGVDDGTIGARLERAGGVPGRFEPVDAGQDFTVVVDYSHKPEALENVLRTARELACGGRVICVLGAGGDRDRAKRPLMGRVAASGADIVVLTTDNPRSEDPEAIIAEIAGGAPEAERITDRREAIRRALTSAASGDVVVIAGKGHEPYQEFGDGRTEPFDDRVVAGEELDALRAR